jgi:archaellum component FlaC
VKPQIPLLAASRDSAMDAMASALSLRIEFDRSNDDLIALRDGLDQAATAGSQSKSQLVNFRSAVSKMPRMTSDLNRAKRGVIQQLDLLISEVDKTVQNIKNIQESVARILNMQSKA